jgi:hypothetical protein
MEDIFGNRKSGIPFWDWSINRLLVWSSVWMVPAVQSKAEMMVSSNAYQLRSPDVSFMEVMIESELVIRDGLIVEGDDK